MHFILCTSVILAVVSTVHVAIRETYLDKISVDKIKKTAVKLKYLSVDCNYDDCTNHGFRFHIISSITAYFFGRE